MEDENALGAAGQKLRPHRFAHSLLLLDPDVELVCAPPQLGEVTGNEQEVSLHVAWGLSLDPAL